MNTNSDKRKSILNLLLETTVAGCQQTFRFIDNRAGPGLQSFLKGTVTLTLGCYISKVVFSTFYQEYLLSLVSESVVGVLKYSRASMA